MSVIAQFYGRCARCDCPIAPGYTIEWSEHDHGWVHVGCPDDPPDDPPDHYDGDY